MADSNRSEQLDAKHEQNAQERLEGVQRWVEYIRENPPDVWGPQQNRLVNSQFQSARETKLSSEHEQRVQAFAEELFNESANEST